MAETKPESKCSISDKVMLLGRTTLSMIVVVIVCLQLMLYTTFEDPTSMVLVLLTASYLVYTVETNIISSAFFGAICLFSGLYLVKGSNAVLGLILSAGGVVVLLIQLWWAGAAKKAKPSMK
ncbi:MAG: hypothetical protein PHG85_06930 [Candidatus Altiarchaeota archaeon]|nr:hypothetical protein [Candidatus Altiarchaeota archaeon]